jgi:hypothetical protein
MSTLEGVNPEAALLAISWQTFMEGNVIRKGTMIGYLSRCSAQKVAKLYVIDMNTLQ